MERSIEISSQEQFDSIILNFDHQSQIDPYSLVIFASSIDTTTITTTIGTSFVATIIATIIIV